MQIVCMYRNKTDDKMDELDHQGQGVKDKESTSALTDCTHQPESGGC